MKFTEHFTYEEMTNSPTAKRLGLSNAPNAEALDNLKHLCESVLEPLRMKYGRPIIVTSGFRSEAVNRAVGGVKSSDHIVGAAADIRTVSDGREDNEKLFKIAKKMVEDGEIEVRQLIDEYNYNWIHISVNHPKNPYKHNQVLHIK